MNKKPFGKGLFGLLLCAALLLALLPATGSSVVATVTGAPSAQDYGIWVNGEQFTSEKTTIDCGSGKATLNPTTSPYTLTLDNATITQIHSESNMKNGIFFNVGEKINIVVNGINTIGSVNAPIQGNGIYSKSDLTLSGTGTLAIASGKDGITCYNGYSDLVISDDCNIKVTSGMSGIVAKNVTITGSGDLKIAPTGDGSTGIITFGGLTVSGSRNVTIESTEGFGLQLGKSSEIGGSGEMTIRVTGSSGYRLGILSKSGNLTFSGSRKITVEAEGGDAIKLEGSNASVLLNGTGSPISLTGKTKAVSGGTVGGTNLGQYKVTGAPDQKTVTYTRRNYCTLTFNMNGHGKQIDPREVEKGSYPDRPDAPTEKGYFFEGWYSDKECTKEYTFDPMSEDTTVYAKWTQVICFVNFCMNDHGKPVPEQIVQEGKKAAKPADPTAEGYTFGGWYTDSGCTKAFDFNTEITSNIDLFAKWTQDAAAPEIKDGANSTWTTGSGDALVVSSSAEFSTFRYVVVNGREIVRDRDYTATAGSTVIALKPEYLKTLAPGTYKLDIVSEGGKASTAFTIAPPAVNIPQTGDNGHPLAWLLLLGASVLVALTALRRKNA